jgi:hypothetical protein
MSPEVQKMIFQINFKQVLLSWILEYVGNQNSDWQSFHLTVNISAARIFSWWDLHWRRYLPKSTVGYVHDNKVMFFLLLFFFYIFSIYN